MVKSADKNPQHMGGPNFTPELDNITFPQSRADLIDFFQGDKADDAFRERLNKLPDRVYNDRDDFRVAFGEELEDYASGKDAPDNAADQNPTAR